MHSIPMRPALAVLALLAAAAQAQTVQPPPRPPGSALVRLEPGMAEPERKRHVRAHHNKFHHGRDYTRDDSIHGHESEVAARAGTTSSGAAGGATVQGGATARGAGTVGGPGTGPARESTGRGASSYFYGPEKK